MFQQLTCTLDCHRTRVRLAIRRRVGLTEIQVIARGCTRCVLFHTAVEPRDRQW